MIGQSTKLCDEHLLEHIYGDQCYEKMDERTRPFLIVPWSAQRDGEIVDLLFIIITNTPTSSPITHTLR